MYDLIHKVKKPNDRHLSTTVSRFRHLSTMPHAKETYKRDDILQKRPIYRCYWPWAPHSCPTWGFLTCVSHPSLTRHVTALHVRRDSFTCEQIWFFFFPHYACDDGCCKHTHTHTHTHKLSYSQTLFYSQTLTHTEEQTKPWVTLTSWIRSRSTDFMNSFALKIAASNISRRFRNLLIC